MKLSHIVILPLALSTDVYSSEVRVFEIPFENVRVEILVQRSTTKSIDTTRKSTENDDAELDVVSIFLLYDYFRMARKMLSSLVWIRFTDVL